MATATLYSQEVNANTLGLSAQLRRRGIAFPAQYRDDQRCFIVQVEEDVWTDPEHCEGQAPADAIGVAEAAVAGGSLSFWDDPSEDIYNCSDGEEV